MMNMVCTLQVGVKKTQGDRVRERGIVVKTQSRTTQKVKLSVLVLLYLMISYYISIFQLEACHG